jgi:hypothetical protein
MFAFVGPNPDAIEACTRREILKIIDVMEHFVLPLRDAGSQTGMQYAAR